jgi:HSP20 family protein
MKYRRDPFSDFFEMQKEMDRLFDAFFDRSVGSDAHRRAVAPEQHLWRPAMDVFETVDTFIVRVEVPGIVPEEDVHVLLERNVLKIRGRRRDRTDSKKEHYHLAEVNYGPFERVVAFPDAVDEESTPTANYDNGFLEVVVPKVPPSRAKEVVVQVRSGQSITIDANEADASTEPPRQLPEKEGSR